MNNDQTISNHRNSKRGCHPERRISGGCRDLPRGRLFAEFILECLCRGLRM